MSFALTRPVRREARHRRRRRSRRAPRAAASCRRSMNATRSPLFGYAAPGRTTPKVVRCSRLNPASTVISFWKLRISSPGADDEDDGERDFGHDEPAAHARTRGAGGRSAARLPSARCDHLLAQVQQRRHSEDEAGED